MKSYTYHKSHSYKDQQTGIEIRVETQWYPQANSVYIIVNNDQSSQGGMHPKDLIEIEKEVQAEFDNGNIKDLVWGEKNTVEI